MIAVSRAVSSRTFGSIEEINAYLGSTEGQASIVEKPPGGLGLAQDLAYDAWEAEGSRRFRLAREALTADERCSDAWLILAEKERTWLKQSRCFEKAVAAAERAAQDEGWLTVHHEAAGNLYGFIPARSYLRAKMALARCLMDGSYHDEARAVYEEMLDKDPGDHMGVRFEIIQVYHEQNDREALRSLLKRFAGDVTAPMAYELLWLALVEDGDDRTVKRLGQSARRANRHVPAYLLGAREQPPLGDPDHLVLGSEEEAADYARMSRGWWIGEPRARAWLEGHG